MFLIPAFCALVADVLVVLLHGAYVLDASTGSGDASASTDDYDTAAADDDDITMASFHHKAIYKVGYLTLAAYLRMIVLFLPLLFHSYTGTALPCHKVYMVGHALILVLACVHMLSLALLNPESMEALVWEPAGRLQHLHFYRRLWYTLLLSVASTLAHFVLVAHVKSSAPRATRRLRYRRPNGGYYYGTPPASGGTLYFAIRAQPMFINGNNHYNNNGNNSEPALVHAMNEFVVDMQARLQRTQQEWSKRLEDFSQRYRSNSVSSNNSHSMTGTTTTTTRQRTPFQVLLELFAYQDVLADGQLDAVWMVDHGRSVTFLVPQLLSFLLHGAASNSSKPLEEWILQKCQSNLVFAHKCYWFLRAWCLEVPLESSGAGGAGVMSRTNSDQQLSRDSSMASLTIGSSTQQGLVPFLDEPAAIDVVGNSSLTHVCGDSVSRLLSSPTSPTAEDEKFLPEERMLIEHFMMRVKECGQEAAIKCLVGDETTATLDDGFHEDSMLLDSRQAALPTHPHTGTVSARHLQTVSSPRRYGFLPAHVASQTRFSVQKQQQHSDKHNSTEAFDGTPRFWDSLLYLADSLFAVPPKERKSELRTALAALECEMLPNNAVYVPLHHAAHRVWRIVPEESVALGTKERVPCIVTLEVVQQAQPDDGVSYLASPYLQNWSSESLMGSCGPAGGAYMRRQHRKGSSFLRLFGGRSSRGNTHHRANHSVGLAQSNSVDSIPDTDDEGMHGVTSDVDEFELVQEWRNQPRHPLRHVPFMNKVADSMKGGLARVSTKVRERLERDRSLTEELQALTTTEALLDSESPDRNDGPSRRRRKSVKKSDHHDRNGSGGTTNGTLHHSSHKIDEENGGLETMSPIERADSSNTLESMGQWGTPLPTRTIVEARSPSQYESSVRRRLDREGVFSADDSNSAPIPSGLLVYGSDHEEDMEKGYQHPASITVPSLTNTTISHDETTPKKGEKTRPPPVVFRESWQAKQERIRATSAYGQHPGWRLLPVLVKANDDLRQEQLASQLIYKMASILARERCPVWLCPYEILALTNTGGIIEAIPDTISLDSLKRNSPNSEELRDFFHSFYGEGTTALAEAKANFVESLAAYCMVCFLLQIKDRHNGNILLDSVGHIIHIDFGFFFLSSPGKNAGFESAPFKLTSEFVKLLDGPSGHLFHVFRELCVRAFLALRKNCMEIILLVEMLKSGNEHLKCFRGRPDDAIAQLRDRFRLDLNDRACREYVYSLIDNSVENWRTDWYDRYQRYFVGVL